MSEFLKGLSRRLFWDVDPETIDERAHCRYVIQRVLERGTLEDIRSTIAHYTMPFMIAEAQKIRSFDLITTLIPFDWEYAKERIRAAVRGLVIGKTMS